MSRPCKRRIDQRVRPVARSRGLTKQLSARQPARVDVRLSARLGGWWLCTLDDRTQPFQAVRIDLGPEVSRQVHGAAFKLFTIGLWRSPAWFLWFVHGAIVVPQQTVDTT